MLLVDETLYKLDYKLENLLEIIKGHQQVIKNLTHLKNSKILYV